MSKELDTVMSKKRLIPSAPFLRLGAQETRFGKIVNTLITMSKNYHLVFKIPRIIYIKAKMELI